MNTIKEIERINEEELSRGIAGTSGSWHSKYLKSAWCYVGNLSHDLSEGDVICVMSQWGEIDDMHLVRDESTGKSRGFAFVKYEDSRSCVLAVDNMVGSTILGRSIKIDHVENYRLPKNVLEKEEEKRNQQRQQQQQQQSGGGENDDDFNVGGAGHAYKDKEMENKYRINHGVDLFDPNRRVDDEDDNGDNASCSGSGSDNNDSERRRGQKRQRKEERKRKREDKEERHRQKEERRKQKRHKDDDEKKKKKKRKHSYEY